MAGLCKSGKKWFIKLSENEDKKRPKIHLGEIAEKTAYKILNHVDNLIQAKSGATVPQDTRDWANALPDGLRDRLQHIGLVEAVERGKWTVSAWVKSYIEQRPDVKAATVRKWKDVESKLNIFFKSDPLGSVTVQHAKNFQVYLKSTCKLGENTLRRHIGIARQFFNAAVDAELITKNPFKSKALPVSVKANESRFFFVDLETTQRVLDACPDAEWRLIFALCRFGGLRCPSEVLLLKWEDIDWAGGRFTVTSPKTEHHLGQSSRVVPLFPELRPLLQDAYDRAKDKAVYCIQRYRSAETNLRTQLERILKTAGVEKWPKLFQNLRSSRETELFKTTQGNIKAVCKWLGNSPAVALQHYSQVTDADFKQAAEKKIVGDAEKKVEKEVLSEVLNKVLEVPEKALTTPNYDCRRLTESQNTSSINPCNLSNLQSSTVIYTKKTNNIDWAIQDSNFPYYSANNADFDGSGVLNEVLDYYCPELEGGGV